MNKLKLTPILLICILLVASLPVLAKSLTGASFSPQSQIIKVPTWLFETNQAADTDAREMMVSSGCDVNGDGYQDVLVGDRDNDSINADNGLAWLFFGSSSGLNSTADITFTPPYPNPSGFFGEKVACAGDA